MENHNEQPLKTTPLHSRHVGMGALMSPFAGFDMPIQYTDIVAEHNAVREGCGMFDVSHMGEIWVTGSETVAFVNHVFTNDVASLEPHHIAYGMMLHAHGGTVDDLLVYKYSDTCMLLVVNASNIEKDYAHICAVAAETKHDVQIVNASDHYGELAVQGPKAEEILSKALGKDLSGLGFYTFEGEMPNGNNPAIVSRTGYTGEDGFEVYDSHENICRLWDTLLEMGVAACGLGCRDTLRFEAGLPLYGNELNDDVTPVEAALSMFAPITKPGGFLGVETLKRQKEEGITRKVVGLEIQSPAPARHGYEVVDENDNVIGHITTGYKSITLGTNLAMALIDARYAKLGTPVRVRIRRRTVDATVVKKRFYSPNYKK